MEGKGTDFLADWQALARQSWDAWSRLAQQTGAPLQASAQAPTPGATWERVIDGMKGYNQWLQAMQAFTSPPGANDWQAQLRRVFEAAGSPLNEALADLDSVGAHGFETLMKRWSDAAPTAALRDLLNVPGIGLAREHQHQQQQLMAAALEYGDKLAAYQALLARANADGIDRLQRRLDEMAENGDRVESLKALYGLWVDAAEAAYAEVAMSMPFREAYGELTNAQMRLQAAQQQQVAALCRQLGVPTRDEVNSLGKRLQELRRRVAPGSRDAQTAAIDALRGEIETLKARVAELEGAGDRSKQVVEPKPATQRTVRSAAKSASKTTVKSTAKRRANTSGKRTTAAKKAGSTSSRRR